MTKSLSSKENHKILRTKDLKKVGNKVKQKPAFHRLGGQSIKGKNKKKNGKKMKRR